MISRTQDVYDANLAHETRELSGRRGEEEEEEEEVGGSGERDFFFIFLLLTLSMTPRK